MEYHGDYADSQHGKMSSHLQTYFCQFFDFVHFVLKFNIRAENLNTQSKSQSIIMVISWIVRMSHSAVCFTWFMIVNIIDGSINYNQNCQCALALFKKNGYT